MKKLLLILTLIFAATSAYADSSRLEIDDVWPSSDVYGSPIACKGTAVETLTCDASGNLQTGVASSVLPTGAATAANQVLAQASLDALTGEDDLSAAINETTAASNEIVAAVADKKFRVKAFSVICDGAATLTIEDEDGTDCAGPYYLAANGGWVLPWSPGQYCATGTANKALHLLSSAAVNCGGQVTYELVD